MTGYEYTYTVVDRTGRTIFSNTRKQNAKDFVELNFKSVRAVYRVTMHNGKMKEYTAREFLAAR